MMNCGERRGNLQLHISGEGNIFHKSESFSISMVGLGRSTPLARRGRCGDNNDPRHMQRAVIIRACLLNFRESIALKHYSMEILIWLTMSSIIISAGK